MKAEERLKNHRHAITVVGESGKIEPGISQRAIVDACEAYDEAKQAIALLRRAQPFIHHVNCSYDMDDNADCCTCGAREVCEDLERYLDGG